MSDYTELNLTGTSENRLKAFQKGAEDMYAIFRPRDTAEGNKIRFLSYKRIKDESKKHLGENYEAIYIAPLPSNGNDAKTLDKIYEKFNIHHPHDFVGYSMSVSDVIALKIGQNITYNFVDFIGFVELKDFLTETKDISGNAGNLIPQRLVLNKYEKIFEMAKKYNPNISWIDTAVISLAADLEEYTGEKVYISEATHIPKLAVSISISGNTYYLTADRSADKTILFYGADKQNSTAIKWQRLPESLDEIARVLIPGAESYIYPYTREDLEDLIRGVVNYEAEEPDGLGWQNLQAMGFDDEDMLFFGMPPYLEEE